MVLENITSCPVCNNTKFTEVLTATDHTATQEQFSIIKCNDCTLLITSPRPSEEFIAKYYESVSYISHSKDSAGVFDKIYFQARQLALRNKRSIIEKHQPKGKLLDIGCGTGAFVKYMQQSDWKTIGIEPSEKARKIASETGIKIVTNIEELPSDNFDVITMWHVLEHVHLLNETILKLKERLAIGGTVFIAVPNYESFDAEHYQSNWAAYDVPRHLWHFSKKSMKKLLEKHGLEVTEIHPMKMDSYYVSLLSEKYQGIQNTIVQILKAVTTGLISNLKARGKSNYSSLIYVAKKS